MEYSNMIQFFIPRTQIDYDSKIRDATFSDFFVFNQGLEIVAAYKSPQYAGMHIVLKHPEFEKTPPMQILPHYSEQELRIKYPFIFANSTTNPILYRRFQ